MIWAPVVFLCSPTSLSILTWFPPIYHTLSPHTTECFLSVYPTDCCDVIEILVDQQQFEKYSQTCNNDVDHVQSHFNQLSSPILMATLNFSKSFTLRLHAKMDWVATSNGTSYLIKLLVSVYKW